MSEAEPTTTLWRPVGPKELDLIKASGMREFPPRLPDQPIFYPVLSETYAIQIARDWNVPASGSGFVTRFEVLKSFLDGYRVEHAGSKAHLEYWIPAEDLPQFNKAIIGKIEVTAAFGKITEGIP
ncbi:ADP-ribosylation/crystallin J1 [Mesorhizobium sp. M2D.F.Ca.ET.185.01.1.1]|uniref:ADP-ribosylation/crystallin J1 n=1 Tax=unclassified Mesorhizobium TaxID=325217 RepID=UPI000FCA6E80|nr:MULTISPECIES: ADP-ribosylation/crystallin J1 [unclassified Mesorhizobium]TGP50549.1 ADP-ribosylation/crystallin J1 [bacterium M00.F.Ca.ET.230.01.1.1]TGP79481.1 ADP-ribosylation/crystallin J1 [bacterium M00.F.Ca.ET.227.01.1.1]TGQ01108.1 ADP-ribosylation/crystallin J1 [bacterium M00.F.Ca.ET.221.01.1.1]TGQ02375.1 ADP-ribosylation/crystallin J1 [bacterium M00.F.Ca.ET.222.01.1.1]TGU12594.1 ADP-ribosylation/crystallin J1 [bacterium M00.F.Ca.ET.163.01.1.1]TGU34240.1 ADP-ribosylation/crystallin J1